MTRGIRTRRRLEDRDRYLRHPGTRSGEVCRFGKDLGLEYHCGCSARTPLLRDKREGLQVHQLV